MPVKGFEDVVRTRKRELDLVGIPAPKHLSPEQIRNVTISNAILLRSGIIKPIQI